MFRSRNEDVYKRQLDYLCGIGRDNICCREHELLAYAEERIARVPGLSVVGRPGRRAGCLSFAVQDVHPFDLATLCLLYTSRCV